MPWFRIDDQAAFHAKIVAAGNAAVGLWARAGAWSAGALTDGFIPKHMVATLGTTSQAKRLVQVGLWTAADGGGYQFHQWAERQPYSKAETERKRAEARERMARARNAKKAGSSDEVRANTEQPNPVASAENSSHVENAPEEFDRNSGAVAASPEPTFLDRPQVSAPRSREQDANDPRSSHNPIPSQPNPTNNSGAASGDRYVSNARASANASPPPKHHPEHPDYWLPDCAECTALLDQRIDVLAAVADSALPPSPHCAAHPDGTTSACGPCGDARRARQQYDADRAQAAATKHTAEAKRAGEDRARAIANCPMCDADGYRGTGLCDHDPGAADRARRGMAAVRAAMAGRPAEHTPDAYAETDEETADA
ncbi:hypothetical protein [Nocardia sp. NPDC046763]|uniref:hypothetical protein n=1 Tax=Nocardia sp. NPDC046763 TaxID=3155256 RepID=UPI00340D8D97